MTYKPKRNPETDTHKNNPEKFSSKGKNKLSEAETEHFLKHGEMRDGTKRELSDAFTINKEIYHYATLKNDSNGDHTKKHFLKVNNLDDSEITNIKKIDRKEYSELIKGVIVYFEQELGIKINNNIQDINIYTYDKDTKGIRTYSATPFARDVIIPKKVDIHTFVHEYIHHICNMFFLKSNGTYWVNTGYTNSNENIHKGEFINEGFTDILKYACMYKIHNKKTELRVWTGYPFQIKSILKLMDLASKKLNKSPEYIYNYMTRGYVIKGYKGLSLFYQAFGKDFLNGLMELGTNESDQTKFIELVKNNYDKLGFSSSKAASSYFIGESVSDEVNNIIGIEKEESLLVAKIRNPGQQNDPGGGYLRNDTDLKWPN